MAHEPSLLELCESDPFDFVGPQSPGTGLDEVYNMYTASGRLGGPLTSVSKMVFR